MPNGAHESRREAIRRLLNHGPLATQSVLADALIALGFEATQSSISRDLKEIGAIKTARGYELPDGDADADAMQDLAGLLRKLTPAGPNLLVIHTGVGAAQRVALALDRSNWPEVIGNIGGDDTVFVATSTATAQKKLIRKIQHAIRG